MGSVVKLWVAYIVGALGSLAWKYGRYVRGAKKAGIPARTATAEWFFEASAENAFSWVTTVGFVWCVGVMYIQGKIAASAEIQRQKEAEWKAREAELETQARGLEEARARIETDRLNLYRSLDNALDTLSAAKDRDFTAAAAVPADRLDDALRAVSRELAAK